MSRSVYEYPGVIKILLAPSFGVGLGMLVNALAEGTTAEGKTHFEMRCGIMALFSLMAAVFGFKLSARFKEDKTTPLCRALFSELFCAVFCSLFVWRFNSPLALLLSFTALAFLLFHSLTDIMNGYIYDLPVLAMAAAGIFFRFWGGTPALIDGAMGAAAGFAVIFAIGLITRGAMGTGDAMLMFGTGALLGWRLTLMAVYCGFIIGGLFVIPLLITRKIKTKDAIPFAPFLAAGSLLSLLTGEWVYALMGLGFVWPWPA